MDWKEKLAQDTKRDLSTIKKKALDLNYELNLMNEKYNKKIEIGDRVKVSAQPEAGTFTVTGKSEFGYGIHIRADGEERSFPVGIDDIEKVEADDKKLIVSDIPAGPDTTIDLYFDESTGTVIEEKTLADGSTAEFTYNIDEFDPEVYGEKGREFLEKIQIEPKEAIQEDFHAENMEEKERQRQSGEYGLPGRENSSKKKLTKAEMVLKVRGLVVNASTKKKSSLSSEEQEELDGLRQGMALIQDALDRKEVMKRIRELEEKEGRVGEEVEKESSDMTQGYSEDEILNELSSKKKADDGQDKVNEIWNRMNESEQHGVMFGLFPKWVDDDFHPTSEEISGLMAKKTIGSVKIAEGSKVDEVIKSIESGEDQYFGVAHFHVSNMADYTLMSTTISDMVGVYDINEEEAVQIIEALTHGDKEPVESTLEEPISPKREESKVDEPNPNMKTDADGEGFYTGQRRVFDMEKGKGMEYEAKKPEEDTEGNVTKVSSAIIEAIDSGRYPGNVISDNALRDIAQEATGIEESEKIDSIINEAIEIVKEDTGVNVSAEEEEIELEGKCTKERKKEIEVFKHLKKKKKGSKAEDITKDIQSRIINSVKKIGVGGNAFTHDEFIDWYMKNENVFASVADANKAWTELKEETGQEQGEVAASLIEEAGILPGTGEELVAGTKVNTPQGEGTIAGTTFGPMGGLQYDVSMESGGTAVTNTFDAKDVTPVEATTASESPEDDIFYHDQGKKWNAGSGSDAIGAEEDTFSDEEVNKWVNERDDLSFFAAGLGVPTEDVGDLNKPSYRKWFDEYKEKIVEHVKMTKSSLKKNAGFEKDLSEYITLMAEQGYEIPEYILDVTGKEPEMIFEATIDKKKIKEFAELLTPDFNAKATGSRIKFKELEKKEEPVSEVEASVEKKADFDIERLASELIRYTYTKMQEEDPKGFLNFTLGGVVGERDKMIEEAKAIWRDYQENAPWIRNDAEFNRLVEEFGKEVGGGEEKVEGMEESEDPTLKGPSEGPMNPLKMSSLKIKASELSTLSNKIKDATEELRDYEEELKLVKEISSKHDLRSWIKELKEELRGLKSEKKELKDKMDKEKEEAAPEPLEQAASEEGTLPLVPEVEEQIKAEAMMKKGTGEMGMGDIQEGGEHYEWAQAIKDEALFLQEDTGGKVKFIEMQPFDVYQGPYAVIEIDGSSDELWSTDMDEVWFIKGLEYMGYIDQLADAISGDEQAIEVVKKQLGRAREEEETVMEHELPYEKTVEYERKSPELPFEKKESLKKKADTQGIYDSAEKAWWLIEDKGDTKFSESSLFANYMANTEKTKFEEALVIADTLRKKPDIRHTIANLVKKADEEVEAKPETKEEEKFKGIPPAEDATPEALTQAASDYVEATEKVQELQASIDDVLKKISEVSKGQAEMEPKLIALFKGLDQKKEELKGWSVEFYNRAGSLKPDDAKISKKIMEEIRKSDAYPKLQEMIADLEEHAKERGVQKVIKPSEKIHMKPVKTELEVPLEKEALAIWDWLVKIFLPRGEEIVSEIDQLLLGFEVAAEGV